MGIFPRATRVFPATWTSHVKIPYGLLQWHYSTVYSRVWLRDTVGKFVGCFRSRVDLVSILCCKEIAPTIAQQSQHSPFEEDFTIHQNASSGERGSPTPPGASHFCQGAKIPSFPQRVRLVASAGFCRPQNGDKACKQIEKSQISNKLEFLFL